VHPLVAGFVDESVGLFLYGKAELIEELERDVGAVSSVLLTVEPDARAKVIAELRRSPYVVDVDDVREDIQRLRDMNQGIMDVWTVVSIVLGTSVVFGVVYNNARIALTARGRDLASLRVLGFSRREVASILIWSLALDVLLAIPLGLWLGKAWAHLFMSSVDQETFRWEVTITPRTYLLAAVVAALAAAASALWVGRSLERLDLIGVLKTRE
jgi:putative ABC transport system permease protein